MVSAWYMNDNDEEDQRSERHLSPQQYIDVSQLRHKCGVLYWKLDADRYADDGLLASIREERGYSYSDVLECSPQKLANYDDKLKSFFTEHIHSDEEIRFVIDGSGYFDVRDLEDKWIRILVQSGDLIILPAGIYHRFTLDTSNYIKVIRLFIGEPVWTPINRPADEHDARKRYLKNAENKFEE